MPAAAADGDGDDEDELIARLSKSTKYPLKREEYQMACDYVLVKWRGELAWRGSGFVDHLARACEMHRVLLRGVVLGVSSPTASQFPFCPRCIELVRENAKVHRVAVRRQDPSRFTLGYVLRRHPHFNAFVGTDEDDTTWHFSSTCIADPDTTLSAVPKRRLCRCLVPRFDAQDVEVRAIESILRRELKPHGVGIALEVGEMPTVIVVKVERL